MIPNQHIKYVCFQTLAKKAVLPFTILLTFIFTDINAQCEASAGTLGTVQLSISSDNTVLRAGIKEEAVVPDGYLNWYILSSGSSNVIEYISTEPAFEIEGEGIFTIHSLVFNPQTFSILILQYGTTTTADLDSLFMQGGGDICAALDLEGSSIEIGGGGPVCGAYSGALTAVANTCLSDSTAQISAQALAPAIVPEGFTQLFLLTSGGDTIRGQSSSPEFIVEGPGPFSIHSLVYDTATLKLDSIGSTLEGIDTLLMQGGGDICASLDTLGLTFYPADCLPPCEAGAGSFLAVEQECLSDGTKRIFAETDSSAVVPEGYLQTYVLTSGENLLIRGLSNTPSFILEGEGAYTIHSLVYDTSALDLDFVIVGITKAEELLSKITQGGGDVCGALDLEGITIELGDCPCMAVAGTLTPTETCLKENGAELIAKVNTPSVVPAGYKQLFLLTSGEDLVIEATSNEPYFQVRDTGKYAIHNLVYNPGSLPIGFIRFGLTTAGFLNSFLIQGGGDICAALDMEGAVFEVGPCKEELLSPEVYPNPVRENLRLSLPRNLDQKDITIQLINSFGHLALSREAGPGTEQVDLDVSQLPEGLYNVRILYGDGRVGLSKVQVIK